MFDWNHLKSNDLSYREHLKFSLCVALRLVPTVILLLLHSVLPFIKMLPAILESNKVTDLFYVPRINTVEGLTKDDISKWNWRVNDKGWVNFPDYQMRLYRNNSSIKWEGLLHSKIVGFKSYIALPQDELYCMIHPKEIDRQKEQNDLYDRIEANGRTKYKV